jgi:hypothetical protein
MQRTGKLHGDGTIFLLPSEKWTPEDRIRIQHESESKQNLKILLNVSRVIFGSIRFIRLDLFDKIHASQTKTH